MEYKIIVVTKLKQNCSIIWCKSTKIGVLIDPGENSKKIKNFVFLKKINIKYIFLTHGHIDHIYAAKYFSKFYSVPIIGPNIKEKLLFKLIPEQSEIFNFKKIPVFFPDFWVTDKQIFQVGKLKIQSFHCPGHSPGHVIFFIPDFNFLVVGDIIFKGSIGRTDLFGGNTKNMLCSIKKIFSLGEKNRILPGHGDTTNTEEEKKNNLFLKEIEF
ncbi:MBL fold metallo-hydrolase [bacterium endosymbiont of Pedicinus badii]|uniref:MBL fold metallo-hydrolase n=1 Tax=bacterium endosymbiont of Pedicinus badii TaxID=1719126 RepID=UPI0018A81D37|nr:MBL fold metallo-hydrolase [bacterium endosymbiont of Pedicinus badii]